VLRRLLPLAALVALTPAAAHGAVALETPAQGGLLLVDGRGSVAASGRIVAWGLVEAPARVDVAGGRGVTVRVTLRTGHGGRRVVTRRGRHVRVPRGIARVFLNGDPIRVTVSGRRVALSIAGDGAVRLRGLGGYDLDGEGWRPWDPSSPLPLEGRDD